MITEDYVNFEIAKLLKEKGFNEPCMWVYDPNSASFAKSYHEPKNSELNEYECSKPTLQMVMKWLREVHNISIEPLVDFGSGEEYWWTVDIGYIKKDGLIDELCGYDSYEEACEDAIKYCLENLI